MSRKHPESGSPERPSPPAEAPLVKQLRLEDEDHDEVYEDWITFLWKHFADEYADPIQFGVPTDAQPGPDKVPILEERVEKGLMLWNPLDAEAVKKVQDKAEEMARVFRMR